jgi:Asp-tRNA(Asn)/Glu-tRNA(Gln) amidotransferase A subunit family amidase
MAYDLRPMKAPRAAGRKLAFLTGLVENPLTGRLLMTKLLADAGVLALRTARTHEPLPASHPIFGERASGLREAGPAPVDLPRAAGQGAPFETVGDFLQAYRECRTTPSQVAERVIAATRAMDQETPPLRALIAQRADDVRALAEASAARWKAGQPIGPLDGIPVAVKDELDQAGYGSTVGTSFLGKEPAAADATVVARLRAQGAVLIGKANMHEVGMGVTGLNPHHGSARNPYAPDRATGGSSSGSAAAVAAGRCPLAVGADGGGSIRIPAALTGIVGLKASFGRVSEAGAAEVCWSVAHIGPMAATVRDAALMYLAIAGTDPADPNTGHQPEPELGGFDREDARGVRLGIYKPWFEDADPEVVQACREAVDRLCARGAKLVEVEVPELGLCRAAHLVSIVSEMVTAHLPYLVQHRKDYGLDVRLNMALARGLGAFDYVHAQRVRAWLFKEYARLFGEVDVLVTPTTGCTAPILPLDALGSGESNLAVADRIMRFAAPANLLGLPAVSVPAGHDAQGLPIGLQIMGRPWEEHRILWLARLVEAEVERRRPVRSARLLVE